MTRLASRSRRQFLKGTSWLALAGILPLPAVSAQGRVVVIGAGLAGLYAASLLEQQGIEVITLEARKRVGGRVLTLDDVPGNPEAGANVIGPNYGRVINMASRLGVVLEMPQRGEAGAFLIDGHSLTREAWPVSTLNSLPKRLKHVAPDRLRGALLRDNPLQSSVDWRDPKFTTVDVPAADYFRSEGLDERMLQLLDVNNSYGNTLEDTSLLSLYRVSASIGRAISMRMPLKQVKGGNSRLPEAMAASLRSPVVLGDLVRNIHQSASGVRLECSSGETYDADYVICALPATAVRKIEMAPVMPHPQQQAFRDVVYHKVTQAHMIAKEPYWEKSGDSASLWTNGMLGRVFTRRIPDHSGRCNITVWINGDGCDLFDVMGEAEAAQSILDEYERIVPASKGLVSVRRVIRWAIDPFNEGAWPAWRPGEISRLPDLLQQPHQRIFFAGEHLGISNSGMEGAMESGERAALDVLRRLV